MSTNLQFIKSASGNDVASVSVSDCFSAAYDVYMIQITKWKYVGTSNAGGLRFIDSSGSVISDSEYYHADLQMRNYSSFQELKSEGGTSILTGQDSSNQNASYLADGFRAFIYNPQDSARYTLATFQESSAYDGTNILGYRGIAYHKSAEVLSGVNFFNRGTGNISATINVYGVL